MAFDGYVIVATFSDRARAEMMQEILEGAEIPCMLRLDDSGGLQPQFAFGLGVGLEVPEDRKSAAQELLREYCGRGGEED